LSLPEALDSVAGITDKPDTSILRWCHCDFLIWNQAFPVGIRGDFVLAETIESPGCAKPYIAFTILQGRIDPTAGKAVTSREFIKGIPFQFFRVSYTAKSPLNESDPQAPIAVKENTNGLSADCNA
jgi:hypothetical protein